MAGMKIYPIFVHARLLVRPRDYAYNKPLVLGNSTTIAGMSTPPALNLPNPLPRMLTTAEAAAALRVTPATVCHYARMGWLDASQVGRRLLIERASVLRLLKNGTPSPDQSQEGQS